MAKYQADKFRDAIISEMQTHPYQLLNPTNLNFPDGSTIVNTGLTKREYFAAMAMNGLLSNFFLGGKKHESIAKWSVEQSDALIEALNK
jgi:hypothetical protein